MDGWTHGWGDVASMLGRGRGRGRFIRRIELSKHPSCVYHSSIKGVVKTVEMFEFMLYDWRDVSSDVLALRFLFSAGS